MQQQKRKQDEERRRELSKARAIIDETEHLIANPAGIPFSLEAYSILYNRVLFALKNMLDLTEGNKDIVSRIQAINEKMEAADYPVQDITQYDLPDNEKQLIAIIQGIKKFRIILRAEHSKNRISSELFVSEDKKVEKLQLKINIESQMKRGKMALSKNMSGSARQYFEKALNTLNQQKYEDEYIASRKQDLEKLLEKIAKELQSANADSVKKKLAEEKDDLDELFAPKKKW